jgi:hypothetical protein
MCPEHDRNQEHVFSPLLSNTDGFGIVTALALRFNGKLWSSTGTLFGRVRTSRVAQCLYFGSWSQQSAKGKSKGIDVCCGRKSCMIGMTEKEVEYSS